MQIEKLDRFQEVPGKANNAKNKFDETVNYPVEQITVEPLVEENASSEKGVIRNILDGHYKGVADVRLRINFFEELQALESAHAQSELGGNLGELQESLNNSFNELLANSSLTEDEKTQAQSVLDEFLNSLEDQEAPSDLETLVTSLQGKFDEFITALNSSFLQPENVEIPVAEVHTLETTEPQETTEVAADEVVEPSPLEALIQSLQGTFNTALQTLTESSQGINLLPEISEPNGKGKAYEKFLAKYHELMSGGAQEGSNEIAIEA